ncbi:MAG TPA: ATP synthase subunit I [Candidatus Dormibacteraeota bacterium]|nr:ATP synthase subunit I [Candidatus Dormibacteraeota bacterium]
MDDADYQGIERRLEILIAGLGATMAVGAGLGWGMRAAEAAAIGTALCWLNFRWLRQGAGAIVRLGVAQAGAETAHVPRMVHAKFFGRLVLLLIVAYAILAWLRLPAMAFLCGLVAVVPAILVELVYEVARGGHRWNTL